MVKLKVRRLCAAGKNGFASPSGVNTVGVNLGLSVGAGQTNSASSVFKLSDISTLAKKYF